jgi:cell division protease FtsH
MDGFVGSDDLVVIAASNLLEKLDPALLRPGRFDRQIFVSPPDLGGRVEILKVHSANKPVEDVDMEMVARQTAGLTGADLANICNEAAIFAGRKGREVVLTEDFNSALERVVAGMESRRLMNEHEKRVVAFHEAGHALCSELLPSVEKVHKVSIVPRGRALGYTLNLPEEDRYLKSKEELTEYLVVLLGGRVAESIVFGSVTTGASDDLKKVNEISRAMIAEYGMGNSMSSRRLAIDEFQISDNTRRLVDDEQADITDVAYRHAHRLITGHRGMLDELATTLLEQEVIERPDLERIVGKKRVAPLEPAEPGPAQIAAAEPSQRVP